MAKLDKYKKLVNTDNFEQLLSITGYTFQRNDSELELFDSLYRNYDMKLKNERINPDKIISGSFKTKTKIRRMPDNNLDKDIGELKFAARKGNENISQSIIDKMKRKHNKNEDSK